MTSQLYLHIGCGTRRFDGFVQIDLDATADLSMDVTQGLPFGDNSARGIYSEHFFEHLSQAQGCNFLRECRRVLAPGGTLRIAMPDLDYCVERYSTDWRDQAGLKDFGLDWIQNRCEFLNVAMREWGHQWIYNEEELRRVAGYAGLTFLARRDLGESSDPMLANREYRQDSKLICEFTKSRVLADESNDLVSIVMAVYKPTHLREALDSALAQSYENCEIVIGDDCPTDAIRQIVTEYVQRGPRFPIHYQKNETPLVGHNFVESFHRARGTYVKFLNDDDTLAPNCVERMVSCLANYPDVMMVTSHRQPIDESGKPLPDDTTTARIVAVDSVFDGRSTSDALFKQSRNFLGEPSTAMFRKRDIQDVAPNILGYADREVDGNNDVSWWLNLLGKGHGIYLVESLSTIRRHPGQIGYMPGIRARLEKSWQQLRFDAQRFGQFLPESPTKLFVRPLSDEPTRDAWLARRSAETITQSATRDSPLVSIVVPIPRSHSHIHRCLSSLLRNAPAEFPIEILFVDDGDSEDLSAKVAELARTDPRARIAAIEEGLCFAAACNVGAAEASGTYLHFLHSDVQVTPGWLQPLVNTLELLPKAAAAGSRILCADGTLHGAGIFLVEHASAGVAFGAINAYQVQPGNAFGAQQRRCFQALSGASLLVRAEAFSRVGGFDEGYRQSHEDVDLGLKLRADGWQMFLEPTSAVIYHGSKSHSERLSTSKVDRDRFEAKWKGRAPTDIVLGDRGVREMRAYPGVVQQPNEVAYDRALLSESALASVAASSRN